MTGPSQAAAPCQGGGREGAASLRLVFSRVREISQGKSEKKRERDGPVSRGRSGWSPVKPEHQLLISHRQDSPPRKVRADKNV